MDIGETIAARLALVRDTLELVPAQWSRDIVSGGGLSDTINRTINKTTGKPTSMTLPTLIKLLERAKVPLWAFLHDDDAVFAAVLGAIKREREPDARRLMSIAALTMQVAGHPNERSAPSDSQAVADRTKRKLSEQSSTRRSAKPRAPVPDPDPAEALPRRRQSRSGDPPSALESQESNEED